MSTLHNIWADYEPAPRPAIQNAAEIDKGLAAYAHALKKLAAPQSVKPPACGFRAWDMMPSCALPAGHAGDHADGFGGHYAHLDPAANPWLAVQLDLLPCFIELQTGGHLA